MLRITVCILALATFPVVRATDSLNSAPLADAKAPALPLKTVFEKGAAGERGGIWMLRVTNGTEKSLTLSAVVHFSVVSHPSAKSRILPAQTLAPGKDWVIADLAVDDRVVFTTEGHEPLTVTVPPGK